MTMGGVPVSFAPEGVAYDLIGDFVGKGPQRIQVKTVMSESWHCGISRKEYFKSGAGGHRRALYGADDIDFFGCVTVDGTIFLIPIAAVAGRTTIALRKFAAFQIPRGAG